MILMRTGGPKMRGNGMTAGAERGFSLIEIAVVMFIIVLLLGSILIPLSTQIEQRQISDTQKSLEEIREALIGFALANGYLPCPDTGSNGSENITSGACTTISGSVAVGRLPYNNIGLGNGDLWGNRYTYVVNEAFARRPSPTLPLAFSLSTASDIRICATQACTQTLSTTAVFAIISHGKNGAGAVSYATNSTNPASGSADEQENYDTDRDIVSRAQFTGGAAASEFDDIVIWLSRYTLLNRMVAAGKLP
jgi:prepilin-type N-terminal cleavage/methylation domain-containing protein